MHASSISSAEAACARLCGPGNVLVLVFAQDWGSPEAKTLDGIRAELRALGASLLVLGGGSLFYFRPDDEHDLPRPKILDDRVIDLLTHAHGPAQPSASERHLTLALLDDEGRPRLRIARAVNDDTPSALLEALRLAGASVLETNGRGMLTRREVVLFSLVSALTLVLTQGCKRDSPPPSAKPVPPRKREMPIVLRINGREHALNVEPRVSLLDALRERLQLTGTKKGCDHGQCGACTVLLDGRRVNACLTLAIMAQNREITTIEGLASGSELHPMQTAFVGEDALQCGYCTPGQIVSAVALLKENRAFSDDEVREQMSGNICRCGAYVNIVRAIQRARKGIPA